MPLLPRTLSLHPAPDRLRDRLHPLALVCLVLALFAVGCGGSDAPQETKEPAAETENSAVELEFWKSVRDSEDTDELLAYIKKYPDGQFTELAESRLKSLSEPKTQAPPPAPPTQTPTQTQTQAPRRMTPTRDNVLRVVRNSLRGYSDPRLYIYPNIPRDQADNAASVHGIDARGILVLYNDGLGGGGKTGFAINDRRVYWRFVSGSQPYWVDFRDIQNVVARKNKFLVNGYEVPTTMSNDSRRASQVYTDLMIDLRNAFR